MEIKCYYEFLKDEFLLVWYCKKLSGTFIKNVYLKMSGIMSAIIYSPRKSQIIKKNFIHTMNLEIINFTMRQYTYGGGFVPFCNLIAICNPWRILQTILFAIHVALCNPFCQTQTLSNSTNLSFFVIFSVTLCNSYI